MADYRSDSVYAPLRKDEIRTISILPGKPDEPVECRLSIISLDENRELLRQLGLRSSYDALSYTWGSKASGDITILVNECRFPVSSNLLHAIQALRLPTKARDLWVDQICINQEDLSERTAQVKLMGRIYSLCNQTIAWIGDESPVTYDVFLVLGNLRIKRWWGDGERAEALARITHFQSQLSSIPGLQTLIKEGFWEDLADATKRPYWKRTWIVQDIVLAPRVTIKCGRHELDWEQFWNSYSALQDATSTVLPDYYDSIDGLPSVEWIYYLRRSYRDPQHGGLRMGDLTPSLRAVRATCPLDKIYGILGMTNKPAFEPDYNTSVADLYSSLVKHCLQTERSLDIISMRRWSPVEDLPSWVPDWRSLRDDRPAHPLVIKWADGCTFEQHVGHKRIAPRNILDGSDVVKKLWTAHGSTSASARIGRSSLRLPVLHASGVHVGKITNTGSVMHRDDGLITILDWERVLLERFGNTPSNESRRLLSQVYDRCAVLYSQMEQRVTRSAAVRDIIARSVVHATKYVGGGYLVEAFVRLLASGRDDDMRIMTPSQVDEFWTGDPKKGARWADLLRAKWSTLHRRLIVTDSSYIGLGPIEAEPGDELCILFGCSVPVVLRKTPAHATSNFIGEAYVEGAMTGALVRDDPETTQWVIA